uniref:Uncharacterized protein n=1 Tax=Anopheles darlingi TaxID=43151 RepID=A0A2M4CVL3_ANODA
MAASQSGVCGAIQNPRHSPNSPEGHRGIATCSRIQTLPRRKCPSGHTIRSATQRSPRMAIGAAQLGCSVWQTTHRPSRSRYPWGQDGGTRCQQRPY